MQGGRWVRVPHTSGLDEIYDPHLAALSVEATAALQLLAFLHPEGLDEEVLSLAVPGGNLTHESLDGPPT